MEYVDLFDEEGRLLKHGVPRDEASDHTWLKEGTFIKVVHGIPLNSQGKILIQRRSRKKAIWPGKWALLGGHVLQDETSEEALLREFKEEYGLDARDAPRYMVCRIVHRISHTLMEFWVIAIDVDLKKVICEPSEVEQVRFVTPHELETIYLQADRWLPGEEPYRSIELDLFRHLLEIVDGLKSAEGD